MDILIFQSIIENHMQCMMDHKKALELYYSKIFKSPSLNVYRKDISSHDNDKFLKPNLVPYAWTSWIIKCNEIGKKITDYSFCPENIYDRINLARFRHYLSNPHHPEFHCPNKVDVLDYIFSEKRGKDEPPNPIDATGMPIHDILEMTADWKASSEKHGLVSCEEWADLNIDSRWVFSKKQKGFIYQAIDSMSK